MATQGTVEVVRGSDGALEVRLGGPWRLAGGIPALDPVRAALERTPPPPRAVVDAAAVDGWDSALVAFVSEIDQLCRTRGVACERRGLPDGAQRLLALAEAVPDRVGTKPTTRPSLLARIGAAAYGWRDSTAAGLDFLGEITLGLGRLVAGRARLRRGDVVFELQRCGMQALPIVSLIAFLVGTILAFVGAVQLQQFGAQIYVANLVAIAMAREMGGIMTSIIMAGRTGSGFAAELGTMRVTQETDALTTMGLRPIDALVLPRVLALMIMMPLLTIYADVVGMLGGMAVGVGLMGISAVTYVNQTQYALTLTSCTVGVGKSVVFGLLVAMAGCLAGMSAGRSSAAVGEATTRAVVTGIVAIIVADGLFAVVFNVLDI